MKALNSSITRYTVALPAAQEEFVSPSNVLTFSFFLSFSFQHRENSHDQQHHVLSEPFTALHENLERSAPAPTGAFLHKTYRGSTVETRVIAGRPGHRTPGRTPNAAQVRVNTQICSYSQVTNSSLRYARLTTERIPCGHFASVLTLHAAQ